MKPVELKKAINQTVELLLKVDKKKDAVGVLKTNLPSEVREVLDQSLPLNPVSFDTLLSELEKQVIPFLNRNSDPRFAAYITGSGNVVATIAEFVKAYYNQNGLKWNNSPIASELEQLVIQWVAEFIGLENHQKGVLTSGGSMSNLMAIHFALAARFPEREMEGLANLKPLAIYCSNQTHSSIDRALVFLGLGRKCLRKIEVNKEYQIELKALEKEINKDLDAGITPFMLVGNAGTTNTGAIDNLEDLAQIAKKYGLWYHVDGAYGLPARNIEELKPYFNGVEKADSVIINPHKWMYVPFEASCILLNEIPKAIHFDPDYLQTKNQDQRWESSEHTIELSKEFRALKVWFTLKYYGTHQLTEFVAKDIALTQYFAKLLQQEATIEVDPSHPLSIICFRWFDPKLSDTENELINQKAVQQIEADGDIFLTGTKLKGNTYLRAYFGNPQRTKKDVEYMRDVIMEILNHL